MTNLDGKVAIVTGASAGIGRGVAEEFARSGATVFITGRRKTELDAAAMAMGASVIAVPGDMSKLDDVKKLYSAVAKGRGKLDIVVANVGTATQGQLGTITSQYLDGMFATNLKSMVFTVQEALPYLRDGGSVILISSTVANKGQVGSSVYCATKAAARAFARSWLMELKDRHIRVNVISPGPIDTEGVRAWRGSGDAVDAFVADFVQTIPLRRLGDPREIGKAAVFLASDAASFVNGADLQVDGGVHQI